MVLIGKNPAQVCAGFLFMLSRAKNMLCFCYLVVGNEYYETEN